MTFVFAESLSGPVEEAVLGIHACWRHDGSSFGSPLKGEENRMAPSPLPPPPPLMVMVAALLRQGPVDHVLQTFGCHEGAATAAKDDAAYVDAHVTGAVRDNCPDVFPTLLSRCGVADSLGSHITASLRHIAILQRSTSAYIEAVRWCNFRLSNWACVLSSEPSEPDPSLWAECLPMRNVDPDLKRALQCAQELSDSEEEESFQARKQSALLELRRESDARNALRQSSLVGLADLRCLLHASQSMNLAPLETLGRINQCLIQRGVPVDAVIRALIELDYGTFAAMLFSVAADVASVSTASFVLVREAARDVEATYALSICEQPHEMEDEDIARFDDNLEAYLAGDYEMADADIFRRRFEPRLRLLAAFDDKGNATVRCRASHVNSDDAMGAAHIAVQRRGVLQTASGDAAFVDRATFLTNWRRTLFHHRGLLADGVWDWSNCVATGPAVVLALLGCDEETPSSSSSSSSLGEGVDLHFYGTSRVVVTLRAEAVFQHLHDCLGGEGYTVEPRQDARYLPRQDARYVEVTVRPQSSSPRGDRSLLRLRVHFGAWWLSKEEVLACAVDVDCCAVAYAGSGQLWLSGRSAAALSARANGACAGCQRVHGSPEYEHRLVSFTHRGFHVVDPLHTNDHEFVTQLAAFGSAVSMSSSACLGEPLRGIHLLMSLNQRHETSMQRREESDAPFNASAVSTERSSAPFPVLDLPTPFLPVSRYYAALHFEKIHLGDWLLDPVEAMSARAKRGSFCWYFGFD